MASPYQALREEVDRRLGGLLSPVVRSSLERALGGTSRDERLEAAVDAAVTDLLKERAAEYLAEQAATTVVVGGEDMATITTGKGLTGNGSPEFPARIADVEALAIARIARIMDQAAALIGKTVDIALEQGSIWTATTELEFVLLNAAPADPASVVTSLTYVNTQTLGTPSVTYAIILKLPRTEDPTLYRLIMRDSTGAVVDGILVGSCIPIVLPGNLPDVYYRIDDPLSGGMLLRDTVGEWATIEAEKDVRQGARSQWSGGYRPNSITEPALDVNLRNRLGRTGGGGLVLDSLQNRIIIIEDQNGVFTYPAGLTIDDYTKVIVQVEVARPAIALIPALYAVRSQTIVLTDENITGDGPHPLDFAVRTLASETNTDRAIINDVIEVDLDVMDGTWHVPEERTDPIDIVTMHIWGERNVPPSTTFEDLTDTPLVLGDALSLVQTNQARDALEFINLTVDDTPIDGVRLALDRSIAGQMTVRLERAQAHSQTRYAAASADAIFTEAEWLAGNTSMTDSVTFPITTFPHYKGFAIPADEASLTDIHVQGSPFNSRASYLPAIGDADVIQSISGVDHKTYIQTAPDFADTNQNTYILR